MRAHAQSELQYLCCDEKVPRRTESLTGRDRRGTRRARLTCPSGGSSKSYLPPKDKPKKPNCKLCKQVKLPGRGIITYNNMNPVVDIEISVSVRSDFAALQVATCSCL